LKKDLHNFEQMFFETKAPDSYGREQTAPQFWGDIHRGNSAEGRGPLNPCCNDPEKPTRSYMHAAAESKGK
jgi:hypothetical protein